MYHRDLEQSKARRPVGTRIGTQDFALRRPRPVFIFDTCKRRIF